MSYTRKVAYNTAAQLIGKVVGTGVSLITTAALFRYFGVVGIGKYTTVFAFVGFFSVFADFGLQWTLIRELTVGKDQNKIFSNIFAFRLLLALVIHALAFALVWFFNYPIDVKLGVGVITAAWFFTTINSTLVGVFLNNYRLDITVTAEVVGRAVILAGVFLMTRAHLSFNLVMSAYLIGNVVNFLINLAWVRRYIKVALGFDWGYWRHAIGQALPIGIVLVFGFVYYKIDSLMLSLLKGMTDVGIYGTAYKLLEVLQTVPAMFLGAAFPLVTRYVTSGDERVQSAFQKQFDFLMLMAVPIVAGTFLLASPIIGFIAGSRGAEFLDASTVTFAGHAITSVTCLKILIFSVGVAFLSNLYSYMIVSLGRQRSMVAPVIGFALLNVVLNLIFIPRWSYLGAASATLLTELVVFTSYSLITRRFIHLPLALKNFAKVVLAGLVMSVIVYLLQKNGINLFVNILAAAVVYVSAVLALRAVTLEQVGEILRIKSNARRD